MGQTPEADSDQSFTARLGVLFLPRLQGASNHPLLGLRRYLEELIQQGFLKEYVLTPEMTYPVFLGAECDHSVQDDQLTSRLSCKQSALFQIFPFRIAFMRKIATQCFIFCIATFRSCAPMLGFPHSEAAKKPGWMGCAPHGGSFNMHPVMHPDDGIFPLGGYQENLPWMGCAPHGGGSDMHPVMHLDDGIFPTRRLPRKSLVDGVCPIQRWFRHSSSQVPR